MKAASYISWKGLGSLCKLFLPRSPPEPDVLGEISDGVIIALHLMADLKLVYTWVLYLK